jgi:hypothetical protein
MYSSNARIRDYSLFVCLFVCLFVFLLFYFRSLLEFLILFDIKFVSYATKRLVIGTYVASNVKL